MTKPGPQRTLYYVQCLQGYLIYAGKINAIDEDEVKTTFLNRTDMHKGLICSRWPKTEGTSRRSENMKPMSSKMSHNYNKRYTDDRNAMLQQLNLINTKFYFI